jgi:hypothetical protein
MTIARVPASALSHLQPGLRLKVRLLGRSPGSKNAEPLVLRHEVAFLAPRHFTAPAGLGRPRRPRRADPARAGKAATTATGHDRNRATVAPPPGHPEMDLPNRTGRPPVSAEIATLIEPLATANHGWGHQGSKTSCKLGHPGQFLLGSNQRRLSRRFYRDHPHTAPYAFWPATTPLTAWRRPLLKRHSAGRSVGTWQGGFGRAAGVIGEAALPTLGAWLDQRPDARADRPRATEWRHGLRADFRSGVPRLSAAARHELGNRVVRSLHCNT